MVPLNLICLSTCITKLFVFDEILLDLSFSNSRISKISHQFWPTFGDTDMPPKYKRLTCREWNSSTTSTNNWTFLKSFCQRNYSLIRGTRNPCLIQSLCGRWNAWACQIKRVLSKKGFNYLISLDRCRILFCQNRHFIDFNEFQWIFMNDFWSKIIKIDPKWFRVTVSRSINQICSDVHQKPSKCS